jgi:hypothetical protein
MAPSLQHFTGAGGHQTGCQRITADELAHRAGHLVRGSKTMRLQDSPAGTRKPPLDGSIDWHGQRKVPVCNHAATDSAYAADTTALPWLRSVPRSRLLCSCCSNKQQAVRCASLVGSGTPQTSTQCPAVMPLSCERRLSEPLWSNGSQLSYHCRRRRAARALGGPRTMHESTSIDQCRQSMVLGAGSGV